MNFRVVSPKITLMIYLGIELLALPFFILIAFGIGPYQYILEMPDFRLPLLLFLSVAIVIPVYFEFYSFGALRFRMDEAGVTYKMQKNEYHLSWSEVKHITLNPDAPEQLSTGRYLCFFADNEPTAVTARSGFNARAFGLQYRKGLPEAIAKYCDLKIENLIVVQKKS